MNNTREFTIKYEQEFKVTLDMDKYNKDTLRQITEYWGYDKGELDEEYIIKESAEEIANSYLRDGYLDKELEGFPPGGQNCVPVNTYINIEEIK